MRELTVKILNPNANGSFLKINGEYVKITKNKQGEYLANYQTHLSTAKIEIETYSPLKNPFWLFISLFYYLISFFGLFDAYRANKGKAIKFETTVDLDQTNYLVIRQNLWKLNEPCVTLDDQSVTPTENVCYIDNDIKKRASISKTVNLVLTAIAIILIVMNFIN